MGDHDNLSDELKMSLKEMEKEISTKNEIIDKLNNDIRELEDTYKESLLTNTSLEESKIQIKINFETKETDMMSKIKAIEEEKEELNKTVEDLVGVEERYIGSLKDLEVLENAKIQAEMDFEMKETDMMSKIKAIEEEKEELNKTIEDL